MNKNIVAILENNIKDKSGKYHNTRLKKSYWIKNNFKKEWDEIILWCSFLPTTEIITSEYIYCYINSITETPRCECNNILKFDKANFKYQTYCSTSCRNKSTTYLKKIKQTKQSRYGDENYNNINAIKKTNIEKYGNEVAAKSIDVIKKMKNTLANKSEEVTQLERKKRKDTNLKRYGVITPSKNKKIQNNIRMIKLKNKLKEYNNNEKYKPMFSEYDYDINWNDRKWECIKCGLVFTPERGHQQLKLNCPICYPSYHSNGELQIKEFIETLNIKYSIKNRKLIYPYEVDFVINNIGIEFDGIYWHSEKFGKDKNYHLNKTNSCSKIGVELLHIFENEWNENKEIWKSVIKSKLKLNEKLGARKCIIQEVTNNESKKFLDNNHLQGNVHSSLKYGLFYNDTLVSLLTISKSRFNKNYDWEITRYCNKKNLNVIGGFSKLLKYFMKNHKGSIITYADKRYSTGELYKKNGFIELIDSPPNYFYIKDSILFSRYIFQKHKLKNKLDIYDENLSETKNMKNNGYYRIWDCGNKVFIINKGNN